MTDSSPQNLMKDRTLKFVTKGPFQRSPRNSAVSNNIVHRQIAFSKVLLDVAERISNIAVFDGKGLGAPSGDNSLRNDSLRCIRRALAIHQPIQERCCFIGHPLEVVADARKWHLDAI